MIKIGRLRPAAISSPSPLLSNSFRRAASSFLGGVRAVGGPLSAPAAVASRAPSSSRLPRVHAAAGAAGAGGGGGTGPNAAGNGQPPPPRTAPPRPRPTSTSALPSSGDAAAPSSSAGGPRVCVLGGGFGGLYTALKLEALAWPAGSRPRVTLVDRGERFVFKPLLYELISGAASAEEVAPTFSRLLAPYRTSFVRGAVEEVVPAKGEGGAGGGGGASSSSSSSPSHAGGGTVRLVGGNELEYDWLVLALGADTVTYGVPGVRENCLPFATFDDATRLNEALRSLEKSASTSSSSSSSSPTFPPSVVVVVGGGYAGVELAAVIAERLKASSSASSFRVELVTSAESILAGAPAGQRAAAEVKLAAAGVVVKVNAAVARVDSEGEGGDVSKKTIALASAATSSSSLSSSSAAAAAPSPAAIAADLVLWTAGVGPVGGAPSALDNASAPSLPFPRSGRGAVVVEPTLRVKGYPGVFALGDVAAAEEEEEKEVGGGEDSRQKKKGKKPLPPTAQVAFQQADYVAWNVWASINSRPLLPFRYQHLGEMMSLGAREGAVTLPFALPEGIGSALGSLPVLGDVLSAAGVRVAEADGVTIDGPLAGALRRAAYWYRQPTGEQRAAVGAEWLAAVSGRRKK